MTSSTGEFTAALNFEDKNGSSRTVVMVDDDPAQRYVLTRLLKQAGFEVQEATTGARALELARSRPDAIILDVYLPDIDGFEVCRQLKDDPETKSILVVQTSAVFRAGEDRIRGLEGGADAYIIQPVKPEELLATLRALFRLRHFEEEQSRLLSMEQAARKTAEEAERRIALLAESSRVLSTTLDVKELAVSLSRLLVSKIADFCLIQVAEQRGKARSIIRAARDPAEEKKLAPIELKGEMPMASGPLFADGLTSSPTGETLAGLPLSAAEAAAIRALDPKSIAVVPMRTAIGEVLGVIVLISCDPERHFPNGDLSLFDDLGRRAGSAVEHAWLYQTAQHAIRSRDDMLSIVSHDLRSPLNTILMSASLMLSTLPEGELGGELQSQAERIRRQAKRMEGLLGDLLDVSAIDGGRLSVMLQDGDLAALIRDLREGFMMSASAKEQRVTIEVPDSLPARFDPRRLTQAISNLVDNAIKFTPVLGEITVRAMRRGNELRVQVADTGPGIERDHMSRIFDRFWHARSANRYEGVGLGLFITKGIVEAHGGKISVESTLCFGTTFTITLPSKNKGQSS